MLEQHVCQNTGTCTHVLLYEGGHAGRCLVAAQGLCDAWYSGIVPPMVRMMHSTAPTIVNMTHTAAVVQAGGPEHHEAGHF